MSSKYSLDLLHVSLYTFFNVQYSLCRIELCWEYYTIFAIFRPQNHVTLSIYARLSLGTCSTFKCGPTILIMSRVWPIINSGGQCCQLLADFTASQVISTRHWGRYPATENGLHSHFWKHEIPLRPFFGKFFGFLIILFFTLFNTISSAASDSTLSEDVGIKSSTFVTLTLAVRRSSNRPPARSRPHSAWSHPPLDFIHP